jgi:tetratricopeptide (TPR) repeat protein
MISFLFLCTKWTFRTIERNRDWQSEGELFLKAHEVCPNSVKVLQNVGILHRRTQSWDVALKYFNRVHEVDPTFCETTYWIGLTHLNAGRVFKGIDFIKKSLPCIYARNNAATALQRIYSSLMSANPGNVSLSLEWADILVQVDQHETASSQLMQVAIAIGSNASGKPQQVYDLMRRARQQYRLAFPVATPAQSHKYKRTDIVTLLEAKRLVDDATSQPEPCELSFTLGMRVLFAIMLFVVDESFFARSQVDLRLPLVIYLQQSHRCFAPRVSAQR